MRTTRDGIVAYVAGGLGNQLFILGAGWEQARRLDCPLYLDVSNFTVNHLHPYGLDAVTTPGQVLSPEQSPWRTVRVPTGRHLPIPRELPGKVFVERSVERYAPAIHQVGRGTTLLGYFQSSQYFPTVLPDLVASLWDSPETPDETRIIAEMRANPAITLHLRRGDYLHGPAVFLATVEYARRAVELVRRTGLDLGVRVFTDSVDVVRRELGDASAGFEFVERDLPLGTVATLKAMAAGQAMIMSNSSFSWWAATLMSSQGGDPLVVAPRPWTADGSARADMLEPGWVTLDAR
ncbi:alpha-1,2-fucosyltransferase [Cellulomonas chitinilytica]|uniref:Alpha-1,2-fucosyltransferase n=1 Tax=Cellulomonas chitinilytica TaxID=398759 RepID=A0A919P1Y2_9CELL|nr:alpha-1,2-fucosyltransferase [Cellulomonas chitinilytica]GIG20176.1 alpha-1,2-fucosyltransferase [Cellulomonas chitinilytica]